MSKRNSRPAMLPLGALAAGFGFASLAMAQAEPPKKDTEALPVVRAKATAETATTSKTELQATDTRIGKGKQELRDVPQSITVLTERLIDDRNLDTLKEALKNTAGISFQAAEGGEEDIRLRGFSLQSTDDIFIDGLRDPGMTVRESFAVEQVEISKGPNSTYAGRGASGGTIETKGLTLRIPAGASGHTETMLAEIPADIPELRLWGVGAHMHYVGVDMLIGVQRENSPGPAEECLLHTPYYSFEWQRLYTYDTTLDDALRVAGGDMLYLRCTYDNTMNNEGVVEALGQQGLDEPIEVFLGEETLDEMCLGVFGIAAPNFF